MKDNPLNPSVETSPAGGQLARLQGLEVGAVPLLLFVGIASIVAVSASAGLLPKNMIGGWR